MITAETLSQLEDADFATEAANLVQGQILSRAALMALEFSNREQVEIIESLLKGLNDE